MIIMNLFYLFYKWFIGLKVPDSDAAPAMFNQASRELWEEVWSEAFSESDNIIA